MEKESTSLKAPEKLNSPFAFSHISWQQDVDNTILPIQVSYSLNKQEQSWELLTKEEYSAFFISSIHQRDGHRCQFCGFKSKKYQEVLARTNRSWELSSLATACIFCAQTLTLERVGKMRSGILVHAPNITQVDLNALASALYVARISQTAAADFARKILDGLMQTRPYVRSLLGSDDPENLANQIKACSSSSEIAELKKQCEHVRLFPLDRRIIKENDLEFNQFPQILAYWRSKDGPFSGNAPAKWDTKILEALAKEGISSPVRWRRFKS
jgi:intracellular multiplication protein IcmJ